MRADLSGMSRRRSSRRSERRWPKRRSSFLLCFGKLNGGVLTVEGLLTASRLRAVCKPAKTSVPRNRVYSQYATRCGTERVVPLNPASFGKLVRVIFPGIQTRRLGVRGESKYHYVDLALDEEHPNALASSWQALHQQQDGRQSAMSTNSNHLDFNNIPRLQADTAAFPAADNSFDSSSLFPPTPRGPASQSQTFVYPHSRGMQPGTAESMTYSRTLRFPPSNMPAFSENDPVDLPSIQPYLPPRTDTDTAEALAALYRTHCTSLIDSIRFCKEKQFFRLYMSFHGTLTVPVQKLFTHPNIAPWIEQCDLVMYRTMVRFVSRLTLQAAPVRVINTLSHISASLHDHIAKTFATHPPHVLEAKLRPATVFAGLLYRLIRVNQSAHAAANLLTIDQNREQMWLEWSTMVSPKRVMEAELPDCGYEEVHKIMTTEMRALLEPLQGPAAAAAAAAAAGGSSTFPDDASLYSFDPDTSGFGAFLPSAAGSTTGAASGRPAGTSQVSTENVLDRWSAFLSSLPARFPQAPARTVLHCISAVGTAALRDLTIMSGLSYGHWWVLKIFVDEMALWMAEMGGFLEPQNGGAATNATGVVGGAAGFASPVAADRGQQQGGNGGASTGNGNGSNAGSNSRMSSMGPTGNAASQDARGFFMPDQSSQGQQQQQQHPQQSFSSQQQQQQHQHQMHLQQQRQHLHQQHQAQQQQQQQQHLQHQIQTLQQQQQHQQNSQQSQQQQQQQFNLSFPSQHQSQQQQPKHLPPTTASQQSQVDAAMAMEQDLDDSGIGLSLLDDEVVSELDLSKFAAAAAAAGMGVGVGVM